uniref:Nematode cuticle collagen N-terminal domain-containing protein n=1 Tax=Parascaris univalens TaxID=6257 RepID=A0A915BTJ4_PARUN
MCSRICKMRSASAKPVQSLSAESTLSWSTLVMHSRCRGRSDRLDISAVAAVSAQLDHLDHQGLMVKMVVMENLENPDQMVVMPRKDKDQRRRIGASTARLDHQDQWDDQAHGDLVDLQGSEVPTVRWDLQDHLEDQAQLDRRDHEENKDLPANQEELVCNTRFLDHQDQWDLLERWDLQARKDLMDVMGCQAARVRVVLRAKMAKTELMDRMVRTANKERLAQRVRREAAITALRQEQRPDINCFFDGGAELEPDLWLKVARQYFWGLFAFLVRSHYFFSAHLAIRPLFVEHCSVL